MGVIAVKVGNASVEYQLKKGEQVSVSEVNVFKEVVKATIEVMGETGETKKIAKTKISTSCSVPQPVRRALGLKTGDYMAWYLRGDEMIVRKDEKEEDRSI